MLKITDDIENLLDIYSYGAEEKVKGTPYTRSYIRLNLLVINSPSPIILSQDICDCISNGADILHITLNNTLLFEIDINKYPFSLYGNKFYPFHYEHNETVLDKLGILTISVIQDGLIKRKEKTGNIRKDIDNSYLIKTWEGHISKLIVIDNYVNLLIY